MKCTVCTDNECKGCGSYSSYLWIPASYLGINKITKFIPTEKIPYEKMQQAATYIGLNKVSNDTYQKVGVMSSGLVTIAGTNFLYPNGKTF